jgi:hypothetical protein
MSKGISGFQRQVMEKLDKCGIVSIFDLFRMKYPERPDENPEVRWLRFTLVSDAEDRLFGERGRERGEDNVRGFRNITALYRMMASLEKRKIDCPIMNAQPRCWASVKWNTSGCPEISIKTIENAHSKLIRTLDTKGWVLRSGQKRYVIKALRLSGVLKVPNLRDRRLKEMSSKLGESPKYVRDVILADSIKKALSNLPTGQE